MFGSLTRNFTGGQLDAILNKVAGKGTNEEQEATLLAVLRDELEVRLIKRILKLFDKNGHRIPSSNLQAAVCDANKDFRLVQPQFATVGDYASRLVCFQEAFKTDSVMSAADFGGRSEKLIAEINGNKSLCNLLSGVYLPIILPRLNSFTDYGRTLEEVFLPAVKFSYEKQFSNRKFYNYREGELAGKVTIVPGTRHEKLIERITQTFVIAIYFPNPLQGFSVFASREQMATLPESLILAGGFDNCSAMAMYPDVLARNWYTPGYDLSALSWQSPGHSLCLEADDGRLCFVAGGLLGDARDGCSSGLLFLGSV